MSDSGADTVKQAVQGMSARHLGLIAGPLASLIVLLLFNPPQLDDSARYVAAMLAWMAIWWGSEAVNVSVTAFLPLVFFPVLGISSISDTAASYSNPIIYMFLGGFVVALAVEKSGLHQRVALWIFSLVGVSARTIIGAFMVVAASISMWISNTSTTIMMLPIAMSVVFVIRSTVRDLDPDQLSNFEKATYLGLAYGATMGGVATLVGTPPNAFMSGFIESTYGVEVDFARWMIVGLPLTIVMLPTVWFLLTRILFPVNFEASAETQKHLIAERDELGSITQMEARTAAVFVCLVLLWLLRKPISLVTGIDGLSDAGIAMLAASALFLIPSGRKGQAIMVWEDTVKLPWGVLILFGGGLALAAGMTSSGLTAWLGGQLSALGTVNTALLIFVACMLVIFLTELTSNLATTATFLPIMAALAVETGGNPMVLIAPVTLAASFAFMLPVATPPNAIIFSTGRVSIKTMMRAGLILNIISVAVLTVVGLVAVPYVFGD